MVPPPRPRAKPPLTWPRDNMPEQISIFELVANASLLVQLVMALLALASIISWMMIFQRWFFLRRVANEVDQFEDHFWSGVDLRELYAELEGHDHLTGIETVFVAGFQEFVRLSEQAGAEVDSIMQGVQRGMRVALNREEERLATHLAFLATVGSTSPYVGLFGTVWGIMNSFRSLANMSQATLASVAARHFRGLGGHRHGAVRRHPGGDRLQSLLRPGGGTDEAQTRPSATR